MSQNRYGEHVCEDCKRTLSERDIECYSIEVDGIGGYDALKDKFTPMTIHIPRICSDCAEGWED